MMSAPAACSSSASLSGVCPPNCTMQETAAPAARSRVMIAWTSSVVSGSKYSRSTVS